MRDGRKRGGGRNDFALVLPYTRMSNWQELPTENCDNMKRTVSSLNTAPSRSKKYSTGIHSRENTVALGKQRKVWLVTNPCGKPWHVRPQIARIYFILQFHKLKNNFSNIRAFEIRTKEIIFSRELRSPFFFFFPSQNCLISSNEETKWRSFTRF